MVLGEKKRRQWERFREKLGIDNAGKIQRARLCREYWPENCRQTMKTADELLSHTFLFQLPWDMEQTQEPVHFPEGIDWGHIAGEDPEFAYQMNRHRYWICLGQAYGLTGDERYAREFVAQLSHWLEKEPQDGEDARLTWRTLEAGLRADYWVRAMALFADSPAVTDEVAGRFLDGLESHGRWLFENPAAGFSKKSNWGIMEYAGLYLLGLILENEAYTEKACRYLRDGLHIQVMDDGMHWEMSPMYHNEVLMACLEVLRLAAIWGDFPFSGEEKGIIEKMARVTLALKTPSGCQPMTGDSDDTDVRDLLSQAALILGDGRLKAGGFPRLDYESIWLFGPEGAKAYQEIKAEPLTPGLTFLPDSGQAVMRSGWGEEDNWLYFVNGPLGGGHGHQDKLHMGLWLEGEEVLQDSGRHTYKDSPLRYRLKSAKAHNVPMLWGKEYAKSKDTWMYEALPQCFPNRVNRQGEYLFLEGLHGGYAPQGITVQRRIVAVSFDLFAVCDTFLGSMPEEIIQSFHFGEGIRLARTGDGVEGRGRKCRFAVKSFAKGEIASQELGTFPISRHYNQLGERASLRVRGKDARTLTTFLIRRQGDMDVSILPEPVVNAVSGQALKAEEAEGYMAVCGKEKIGLVFLHSEAGNARDYNGIGGICGLGRTMACRLSQNPGRMTVLQW